MAKPQTEPTPTDELIARFQVETDKKLKTIQDMHVQELSVVRATVASMVDEMTVLRNQVTGFEKTLDGAMHQMKQGVNEVNQALKVAVAHTQKAENAAAVYEKLKASQPNFQRMVEKQNVTIAQLQDGARHVDERLTDMARRLDEFDVIAEDHEYVKNEVTVLDRAVGDLKTRKSAGVPA
jgi:chromosome segregation ATPase